MAGHWQLVLDFIDAGIEPDLPHKIHHLIPMRSPLGHPVGQEKILFHDIARSTFYGFHGIVYLMTFTS